MPKAYYNEFDPAAAAWLRELIKAGLIADGDVDTRSIKDVHGSELAGYTQCHFFAGIGGWSLALRLAGWPDAQPVWTGSCPCQPFSAAGKGKAEEDPRHLWPDFARIIAVGKPAVVFGEQVASAAGRKWLAGVRADLENLGYAVGAADLCAASAGAPHIRQRLYWLADLPSARPLPGPRAGIHRGEEGGRPRDGEPERRGATGGVADAEHDGPHRTGRPAPQPDSDGQDGRVHRGSAGGLEHTQGDGRGERGPEPGGRGPAPRCSLGGVEYPDGPGRDEQRGPVAMGAQQPGAECSGDGLGAWAGYAVIQCGDGKARRFEPGSFPLAHGIPGRVGLLRGYGNAIVPQNAAEFIQAYMTIDHG